MNGSFIPEKRIREFRDLNRYRKSVIRDITSQKNRIEKFLQSSGFRLSSFISDIFGASGRNIILHLIEHGQIDKTALDSCLKTKTRNRIDEILMSVNGTLSEHQKAFLRILMTHYDSLKKHLAEIETSLEEDMAPFALQVEQLNSIYGISITASCAIIAEIGIDMDTYSAYINPYCLNSEGKAADDILLSVYRREFDGRFTEIATGIDQLTNEVVVDPHPALDYARYRIVATTKSTGAVSYSDPPGYPVSGKAVIIQWNEEWSNFDATADSALETPPWSGSLLKLPYNVDVSDNNSPDVAFAEYIGRENPVSYYGTQLGSTATWNTAIDKKDKETLYALRRLQIWMGDAYVREPSGSGYWANIKVSFSQKHTELTVPVTLDITRVEGGA